MGWRERLRLACVFTALALLLLVFAPFQLLFMAIGSGLSRRLPVYFHRVLLKLFDVRVHHDFKLPADRPLLIVSNHISWLDIPVLASIAPMSFVAKADISVKPPMSWLAKMQRTIFVSREDRKQAGQQANEIAERLANYEIIVLFPEGTTSDGNALLPLKTPLFEAAKLALGKSGLTQATVLPVAIRYERLHGMPLGRHGMASIGWTGEIGLEENLLPLVARGALDVQVLCGKPLHLDAKSNRKKIAAKAADAIRALR